MRTLPSEIKTARRGPLKQSFEPMEAASLETLPRGPEWQYEPKWDGFRCLVFRDGDKIFYSRR